MEDTRPVVLHERKAFEEALKNYQVSVHGKEVLASTPFVALMGLAGGGRNTIMRLLSERYNYIFAVSDTTRPAKFRDGRMEQNGIDYYFREEADMLKDIQDGEFIEAELIHDQQVSGTSIREVERAKSTGKIPIHDFEYGGAAAVHRAKPNADIIGLLPPSYDEWIRRFTNREEIHEQEFMNRLRTAKIVLERMLSEPYVKIVINDNMDQCMHDIRQIVESKQYPADVALERKAIAKDILRHVDDGLDQKSI
jgi:guanylate kinase